MELLLDGNRGIYIPQVFCKQLDVTRICFYKGMESDIQTCLNGPDDSEYWDAWEIVLDRFKLTVKGIEYTLAHYTDLWAATQEDWDTGKMDEIRES